jgi:hypothetical protein
MKKEIKKTFVKRKEGDDHVRVSHRFVNALSIVSIFGFAGIVSYTIFSFDLSFYVEAMLMITIGAGLMIEARMRKLKSLSRGITSNNITHLTTIIIGFVAILSGIFSFPQIRIENPSFLAIKGIVSLIAMTVIIIQTWFIR